MSLVMGGTRGRTPFGKPLVFLFLFIASFFCFSNNAYALVKERFNLTLGGTYRNDNNFWKAERGAREVHTWVLRPGFHSFLKWPRSILRADYTAEIYRYGDDRTVPPGQPEAGEYNYVGGIGYLIFKTEPTDRLTLRLDEAYHKTRDPASSDRFSNSSDRLLYYVNRVTPYVLYDLGTKFQAKLQYRNTVIDYYDPAAEDSLEHRGIFDFIYNFNSKTSLYADYELWHQHYDELTSDYFSQQIQGRFTRKFRIYTVELFGGYQHRDFDEVWMDDANIGAYRIALLGQDPPEEVDDPKVKFELAAERNFNDLGYGEQYFRALRFSFKGLRVFRERWIGQADLWYQDSNYLFTQGQTNAGGFDYRHDKHYYLSGSLGYRLRRWLTLALEGGYENRNSNLLGHSFDNRFIEVRLDFRYDVFGPKKN